jgi:hypothetical protein
MIGSHGVRRLTWEAMARGRALLTSVSEALGAFERRKFVNMHLGSGLDELTMVLPHSLTSFVHAVDIASERSIPGAVVECGVWRGGASFLAAQRLRERREDYRRVWMFDSFEGLPPPKPIDGPAARAWAENSHNLELCTAAEGDVRKSAESLGLSERVEIVAGWFEESLPANAERIGPIAVLRIDADWYDSVKTCLDVLYDQVSFGGIIIIDDYYTWEGCTLAVHDFLSQRQVPDRIQRSAATAMLEKGL